MTSLSGQVLGIDPQTGLLGFVSPGTASGSGSGITFVLVNPLDPSSPVEPGDPVVVLTSTGQYCAFSTSQPLSCGTSGMVCDLNSPSAASTLTYRYVCACLCPSQWTWPPARELGFCTLCCCSHGAEVYSQAPTCALVPPAAPLLPLSALLASATRAWLSHRCLAAVHWWQLLTRNASSRAAASCRWHQQPRVRLQHHLTP